MSSVLCAVSRRNFCQYQGKIFRIAVAIVKIFNEDSGEKVKVWLC